ncbi:hypothetical protein ASZ78_015954 [Callipepla squamata]|uniref:SH3 domain-binding glutamic acid-rich-like protein n=1 Tax=Callipepla squamata TaxID=9009 RepID=A0A226MPJ6_CALSU|nr:hypothetical protein ASZ78_015954 [Callipepla squamata]
MVIKVYIASSSGSTAIKKQQQDVLGFLEANKIEFEEKDIAANEENRKWMRENVPEDRRPASGNPLPPRLFNDSRYLGDYEAFFEARENNAVYAFLGLTAPPGSKLEIRADEDNLCSQGLNGTLVIRLLLTLVIMLAEGILTRLIYKDICHQDKPHKSHAAKKDKEGIWREKLVDSPKIKGSDDGLENPDKISAESNKIEKKNGLQQRSTIELPAKNQNTVVRRTASGALRIPRAEQSSERMDLCRSWSCNSIYQNYPDLHIGGDHVGDHPCDSGCVLDHVCDELSDGPVILSVDIPLGQSLLCEHPEKPGVNVLSGDEAEERSMMFREEPLSNSLLNNYMEAKVAELYKQLFEEILTSKHFNWKLITMSPL